MFPPNLLKSGWIWANITQEMLRDVSNQQNLTLLEKSFKAKPIDLWFQFSTDKTITDLDALRRGAGLPAVRPGRGRALLCLGFSHQIGLRKGEVFERFHQVQPLSETFDLKKLTNKIGPKKKSSMTSR